MLFQTIPGVRAGKAPVGPGHDRTIEGRKGVGRKPRQCKSTRQVKQDIEESSESRSRQQDQRIAKAVKAAMKSPDGKQTGG